MAEKPRDRRPVKAGGVKGGAGKGGAGKPPRKGRAGEPRAKPAAERMVRKQVLLTSGQSRWLKRRALETGLAESEIIRSALDREVGVADPEDDWRERLVKLVGSIDDSGFADRMAENKKAQAEAWRKRLERTRKALGD